MKLFRKRKILLAVFALIVGMVISQEAAFADTATPQIERSSGAGDGTYTISYETNTPANKGILLNVFAYKGVLGEFDVTTDRTIDNLLGVEQLEGDQNGNFSGEITIDKKMSAVFIFTAGRPSGETGEPQPADEILPQDENLVAGGSAWQMPVQIIGTPTLTVSKANATSVSLSWNAIDAATSYKLYRVAGKSEEVVSDSSFIKELNADVTSFTDKDLAPGTDYSYGIVACRGEGALSSSDAGLVQTSTASLAKPALTLKAGTAKYNSIVVKWTAVNEAAGYEIYQAKGSGAFKLVKTVTGAAAGSYTAKGLLTGTKYTYKIRAFVKSGNKTYFSSYSTSASLKPYLPATKIKSITAGKKKLTLKWTKISGASGYVIYRATKKAGSYKAVKTIKKGSTVTFTNTKLTSKKTYYYKIRAYRTVSGKKVYAAYSAISSKKVK